ncbi:DUF5518 domain-containing protein [Methanobacterium sp.]|uniref:DUF5518 domain-containing protein n=1 Tax=Methanobacterium sp. TaxID=2164 RepID=UPI003C761923
MVERRSLIIGIAFTISAYFILSLSEDGGVNAVIAFLLGGVVVGFIIEEKLNYAAKMKYSLTHGIILGIIAGVISIVILIIQLVLVGLASILGTSIIISVLILLAYDIIAALVGAVIGNFIKAEYRRNIEA